MSADRMTKDTRLPKFPILYPYLVPTGKYPSQIVRLLHCSNKNVRYLTIL
jgi:hypothetical protein